MSGFVSFWLSPPPRLRWDGEEMPQPRRASERGLAVPGTRCDNPHVYCVSRGVFLHP